MMDPMPASLVWLSKVGGGGMLALREKIEREMLPPRPTECVCVSSFRKALFKPSIHQCQKNDRMLEPS